MTIPFNYPENDNAQVISLIYQEIARETNDLFLLRQVASEQIYDYRYIVKLLDSLDPNQKRFAQAVVNKLPFLLEAK